MAWGKTGNLTAIETNATKAYVQSRAGTDLVTNGTGLLGNNTNFSGFSYDPADAPIGASFNTPLGGGSGGILLDEHIPVDLERRYLLRFAAKQKGTATTARAFSMLVPVDGAGNLVRPQDYMAQPGTLTTLAAALNPGDTTVTLTSSASWYSTADGNWHLRGFIFWDYVDPSGKAWAQNTYSRNNYLNMYAGGGISGNVITLLAPWAGPAKPAGTKVSNSSSSASYLYGGMVDTVIPADWTTFSATFGGAHPGGGYGATTAFPPGTAFVKIGFLANRQAAGAPDTTSKMSVAALSFSDATAAYALAAGALPATHASVTNSRTPTGPAGGDLTGTYPNPTLAASLPRGRLAKVIPSGTVGGGGSWNIAATTDSIAFVAGRRYRLFAIYGIDVNAAMLWDTQFWVSGATQGHVTTQAFGAGYYTVVAESELTPGSSGNVFVQLRLSQVGFITATISTLRIRMLVVDDVGT